MDKSALSAIFSKIVFAIAVIALVDIVYLNWWVFKSDKSEKPVQITVPEIINATPASTPMYNSTQIDIAAIKPSPATIKAINPPSAIIEKTQTVVQNAQKEIFIPIGSGYRNSRDFVDVPGLEVTIDATKYSAIESVVFQGSIWVEGGNGKAHAQLYIVDDKNPIYESQIANDTGVAILRTSNNIYLPASTKTYRIQVKTDIIQYAAHIENARIKITLK